MAEPHSTPDPAPVEYREIPGWPGYRVTSRGEVQSCFARAAGGKGRWVRGELWRPLSVSLDPTGRQCVRLSCGKKKANARVHRLVLLAFVGPCPVGMECCHENGDPIDNRVENLRWGTHTDNMADRNRHGNYTRGSRHFNAKLTEDDVRAMRRLKREGWSLLKLARRFSIAKTTVAQIVRGQFWKHVGDESQDVLDEGGVP
jgi:hypothetical protein